MSDVSVIKMPNRAEVERLMKRCQIGCGGRNALDDAHGIMAECYGMLGRLIACCEARQQLETLAAGPVGELQTGTLDELMGEKE